MKPSALYRVQQRITSYPIKIADTCTSLPRLRERNLGQGVTTYNKGWSVLLAENITGLTSIKSTLANNLLALPLYGILRKYHGGKYE